MGCAAPQKYRRYYERQDYRRRAGDYEQRQRQGQVVPLAEPVRVGRRRRQYGP